MAEGLEKERLLSRRRTLLTTLGRAEAFVENYDAERDQAQVQMRITHLDNMYSNLESIQQDLEDLEDEGEGEPTDQWSSILEHLMCTRLNNDTLKAWEDHASTVEDPNYFCLIEFLNRRTRVLESISVNHHNDQAGSGSSINHSKKPYRLQLSCSTTSGSNDKCPACNHQHLLMKCLKFNRLSLVGRQQLVNSERLCSNCLKRDHFVRECPSTFNCKFCNRRHHTLLHQANADGVRTTANTSRIPGPTATPSTFLRFGNSNEYSQQALVTATEIAPLVEVSTPLHQPTENVFLLTAVVQIVDAYGQTHLARALLDSASQPNLITVRMAHMLRLKRNNVNVTIQVAGQMSKLVRESVFTQIKSRKENFCCGVNFLVMDKVTANLPSQNISTTGWKIPSELFLADPSFNESQPIDMVLGAKHFHTFFPNATRVQLGGQLPMLIDSVFGWIVAGSACSTMCTDSTPHSYRVVAVSMLSLEESLERFWKTEELAVRDKYSVQERQCESFYKLTTTRNNEGRYIVRLPRVPDFEVMLGESKSSALRRFEQLERKLEREPKLKEGYHEFIREYIDLGHMRQIENSKDDDFPVYYLPHHPVIKDSSSTTKLRVVFDASAKTSTGFSLNDALRVGPVAQDELLTLILRFRTYQVALVSDIAKMYRQILVHRDDISLQRILWRFPPHSPIQIFELLTVTYGLAPSSFLATRTLQQLALDSVNHFPIAATALQNNFYMDDFIGGTQSIEDAIHLRKQLTKLLAKGGFELRKWTSNKLAVLSGLRGDQIGTQSVLTFSPNETIKTLGICWEPEPDSLRFDSAIISNDEQATKRTILSTIAKLFDPLGLIAPVVIKAKIIMQELWLLSCDWDDPVPKTLDRKWKTYCRELPNISAYRVDRYAFLPNATVMLHTFADASEAAYGACTYARSEDSEGNIKVQLLASKSRVAPLKRLNSSPSGIMCCCISCSSTCPYKRSH
ncbi:uncharacterized protein LOC129765548 [Toxorhynchites rutilus septentrionalis]|uniref:uncharacterized protein LOC129765548 n=1 Tax=Toxorhynchites rutilus septentrionalis TaxID=329112 RepID=UPI00247AA8F0|nr:uncharacterized protein LOC129765548 [Toxorhynchites rutilus septentrionalis]